MGIYFRLNVLLISVAIQTLGEITFFPEIYTYFWKKSKIVISENQKIYSESPFTGNQNFLIMSDVFEFRAMSPKGSA